MKIILLAELMLFSVNCRIMVEKYPRIKFQKMKTLRLWSVKHIHINLLLQFHIKYYYEEDTRRISFLFLVYKAFIETRAWKENNII